MSSRPLSADRGGCDYLRLTMKGDYDVNNYFNGTTVSIGLLRCKLARNDQTRALVERVARVFCHLFCGIAGVFVAVVE